MLERYCDILVIGSELPGLITAAFLARRGLSVQVVDTDINAENPKTPDPTCLANVHSKLLRSILGRLNVPEMTIQSFMQQDATLQVIFPRHRIDIAANPLLYFEELEREFPAQLDELKLFYENQARTRHQTDVNELFQKLLPNSWSESRALKRFVRDNNLDSKNGDFARLAGLSPVLSAYLKAQFLVTTQSLSDAPFDFQVAELFNPGDGEIFSIHPGISNLRKILFERIIQHDGSVRRKVQVLGLPFHGGVFDGAELSDAGGTVLAKYVIWNAPLKPLATLLPRKWRFRGLRKQCELQSSDFHWFSLRFAVEPQYIPDPMKASIVDIADENREFSSGNLLLYQVRRPKSEGPAHIDVHFLLPASALSEPDDFFEPFFENARERLLRLLPFAEKSLQLTFPLPQKSRDENTLFPLDENDFDIMRHAAGEHGVSHQIAKNFLDQFPLHYQTAAPNFFITHPRVFAAFGLESKLILGLKITDIIWQEVDKSKKRAMKSERRIA